MGLFSNITKINNDNTAVIERDDHFFREAEYIVSASFINLDLIYLDDLKKNKSFY